MSATPCRCPRRHPEKMFAAGNGRSRNRRGQWHELVQHLTDLAYLTPAKFARWHALRAGDALPDSKLLAAIAAAVADFLREDDYAEFRLLPVFPVGLTDRLSWIDRFLSPLVYRAALYTSFDGDLSPRPAYVIGERSPFGRSLAFRMRVYFHDYYDRRSEARKHFFDARATASTVQPGQFLGRQVQAAATETRGHRPSSYASASIARQSVALRRFSSG